MRLALNVATMIPPRTVDKRVPGASQVCARLREGLKRSLKRLVGEDLVVAPRSGNAENNVDHSETVQPLSRDKMDSMEPQDHNCGRELR